MTGPLADGEFNSNSFADEEIVGGDVPGFDAIIADFQQEIKAEETRRRHAAYSAVQAEAERLLTPTGQAYHTTYVPINGDTGERRLFLVRTNMPGHGNLLRVIINDECSNIPTGGRTLNIRDCVVAVHQKTHTFQESLLWQERQAKGWALRRNDGPILEPHATSLRIVSGAQYNVNIPKTKGYPLRLGELMIGRVRLEQLAQDLRQLSGATHEPDMVSQVGFMS